MFASRLLATALLLAPLPALAHHGCYPFANVAHVVAVMVFFAAVAVMDLRLLRVIRGMPVPLVIERLRPVALVVIAATGLTLFVPEAAATARNPAFLLKLAAIALALGNIAVNEWALRRDGKSSRTVQVTAGLSLALWLSTAALGRAIAYV